MYSKHTSITYDIDGVAVSGAGLSFVCSFLMSHVESAEPNGITQPLACMCSYDDLGPFL